MFWLGGSNWVTLTVTIQNVLILQRWAISSFSPQQLTPQRKTLCLQINWRSLQEVMTLYYKNYGDFYCDHLETFFADLQPFDNWTDYSKKRKMHFFQSVYWKRCTLTTLQPIHDTCTTTCWYWISRLYVDITYTSPYFSCSRGVMCSMFSRCFFSPPVQAGRGALRVEQAPERQVHGSYGASLLEHGT